MILGRHATETDGRDTTVRDMLTADAHAIDALRREVRRLQDENRTLRAVIAREGIYIADH